MPVTVSPISSLLLPPSPSTSSPPSTSPSNHDHHKHNNVEDSTNTKSHHIGNPPTSFTNPWPSYNPAINTLPNVFRMRFNRDRPAFVPVPASREELVGVREVDFATLSHRRGHNSADADANANANAKGKVVWLGHASFLVQTSCPFSPATPAVSNGGGGSGGGGGSDPTAGIANNRRGVNILLDPVFSERTSPFTFLGPKRYTPTPCSMEELATHIPIDVVLISHNHYDHADAATLRYFHSVRGRDIVFVVGLGNGRWLMKMGVPSSQIVEMDWWDQIEIAVRSDDSGKGDDTESSTEEEDDHDHGHSTTDGKKANAATAKVKISCTPSQHGSARSPFDRNCDLWCSYAIEDLTSNKKIYFAGDTGYRAVSTPSLTHAEEDTLPSCPAFKTIGSLLGPFNLALLPIGLCTPRVFMSNVHANSWDSIRIHQDIRSKKSIGMHWGTVRGGLSQEYEDVRTPPRDWKTAAGEAGLKWKNGRGREKEERKGGDGDEEEDKDGWEIGLMDVGEILSLD